MANASQFTWDSSVPNLLNCGSVLTKWEEESNSVADLNFRVDEYGFYLAWCEEDKVGNCLDLCHVSEVRPGGVPKDGSKAREALQSRGTDPQEDLEDRCFTVIYGPNLVDFSCLHLCANTAQLANEWIEGLGPLLHNLKLYNCSPITHLYKLYVKVGHLVGPSGKVSVKNICKCLNASLKYEQNLLDGLEALGLPWGKNDELEPGIFTFEQFYELYLKVCPRLEIDQLRVEWGGGRAPYLTAKQMVDFLNKEQRDPRLNEILFPYYDKERAQAIIRQYESSNDNRKRDRITVKGLTRYLLSEDNLLVMPNHVQIYQDMNQPMSHYFINSSHNTYLVGRQIGGKSSVDMYRQCLLAGCRCIELDCWDGPGDEPIITHGKAMCTNIWFKDVIEAIRDTAFVTSEYPVILSFENHCSKQQQGKMACYCTDIFGEMLLTKPLEGYPLEEGKPLPSPQVLKGRIIIKNKKLKPEQEQDDEHSEIFSDLDSCETTAWDLYLGLRRGSAVTLSSFGSRMSQKTSSLKETTIDDIDENGADVADDVADSDVAGDVTEHVTDDRADETEGNENSEGDPPEEQAVHANHSNHDAEREDEASSHTANDGVEGTAREEKTSVDDAPADDIRLFKSASEYSVHSLSKILDGSDLNPALKQDIENELYSDIARTKQLSSVKDEKESIGDVDGSADPESNPKLPNGLSSSSSSSIVSDTPSDVSESTSTQALTDTSVAKGKGTSLPDVVPTSRFKQNGGLESIQEVADASETTVDVNSNTTEVENTRRPRVTSVPVSTRKGSATSLGFASSDSIATEPSRKSSCASVESNPDEDEERDVLEALVKKREQNLASYGSSLRLAAYAKKTSRAQSITPEDMADILALSHQTTSGNIHPYLSSLVNYIHPVSFAGFKEAEKKNLSHHISSFNEANGFSLMKASPVDFVKYNKRQQSRIYPKGARVDSSNYMPQVFWNVGCQMVSLNFQTSDLAFQLNQGKFEYNGRTGFILKPDIMRRADRVFDPFTEAPIDGLIAASLSVRVISGQYLSDKKVSTYVEVDLYGLPTDTIRKKHKTKVASGNGMNPVYEKEEFKFKRLVVPELALLRFGVVDDNDGKLIAQRVVPLEGIQAGYRHIPMRSEHNMPLPLTTLFVHISLRTYVPEKYSDFVDELSEPMKYQSAADKRAAQMQVYEMEDGVLTDDSDLPMFMKKSTSQTSLANKTKSVVAGSTCSLAHPPLTPGSGGSGLRPEAQVVESNLPKKEDTKFPPIPLEDLKKDKAFLRVLKRHQKDAETLWKRYDKERSGMRRLHTSQLEKLVTNYEKLKLSAERTFERAVRKSGEERVTELKQVNEVKLQYLNQTHTDKAKTMLSEQTEEWTNMINRQVEDEIDYLEQQAETQLEAIKKVLDAVHEGQLKELASKHTRENIEIKKRQTKQSMEASKNLAAEKAKSSKDEKDRFQKELDRQNLNRFVEERQKLLERQEEELEEHRARHINEKKEIETEFRKIKAERMEDIKSNGEALRRKIHTAFQTVLPSH